MRILPSLDLEHWSQVATISGVVFATATLVLGLWQFLASLRTAELSHINGLFRDMLRLEFDYYNAAPSTADDRAQARRRMHSYRMWVLEEMWTWLQKVRKRPALTPGQRATRAELVRNWNATLEYHLARNGEKEWADLERCEACYNHDFYAAAMALRPAPPTIAPIG